MGKAPSEDLLERFIWRSGEVSTLPASTADDWCFRLNTDAGIVAAPGQAEGHASIGIVLKDPDECRLHEISARIGWAKDHHEAEYRALISGLRLASGHGIEYLHAFLDSRSVVNQVNGGSKVRGQHLKPLCLEVRELLAGFAEVEVQWVPRAENAEADACAGRALRVLRSQQHA